MYRTSWSERLIPTGRGIELKIQVWIDELQSILQQKNWNTLDGLCLIEIETTHRTKNAKNEVTEKKKKKQKQTPSREREDDAYLARSESVGNIFGRIQLINCKRYMRWERMLWDENVRSEQLAVIKLTVLERGEEFVSAYESEGGGKPYHNRVRIFV